MVLVHYQRQDGRILGAWQTASEGLLEAQGGDPAAGTAYQQVETEVSLPTLVEGFYLLEGVLLPKRVLTLTAERNAYASHAPWCWHVRMMPFEPCTLLVNGIPYALTEDDQTLELDSDEPHTFLITLAPMAQVRAEPLTLEGQ